MAQVVLPELYRLLQRLDDASRAAEYLEQFRKAILVENQLLQLDATTLHVSVLDAASCPAPVTLFLEELNAKVGAGGASSGDAGASAAGSAGASAGAAGGSSGVLVLSGGPASLLVLEFGQVAATIEYWRLENLNVLPQKQGSRWLYPGQAGRVARLDIGHYLQSVATKNLKEEDAIRRAHKAEEKGTNDGVKNSCAEGSGAAGTKQTGGAASSSAAGPGVVAGNPRIKYDSDSSDVEVLIIDSSDDEESGEKSGGKKSPANKPGGKKSPATAARARGGKTPEGSEGKADGGDPATQFSGGSNAEMQFIQYSRHIPLKGLPHPSPVSEPLAVGNVDLPKIPENFELRVPWQLVDQGRLSSPQLETVAFAALRTDSFIPGQSPRMNAYLLGDGTGCGKGRVISSLIIHNWNHGIRRHIWVSASGQLIEDSRRDLNDLAWPAGNTIPVMSCSEFLKKLQANNPNLDLAKVLKKSSKGFDGLRAGIMDEVVADLDFDGIDGVVFFTYNKLARDVNNETLAVLHWFTHGECWNFADEVDAKSLTGGRLFLGVSKAGGGRGGSSGKMSKESTKLLQLAETDSMLDGAGAAASSTSGAGTLKRASAALEAAAAQKNPLLNPLSKKNHTTSRHQVGILAFDEAHKVKNMIPAARRDGTLNLGSCSKMAIAARDWQELYCRNCKVIYSSATAATEVRNMAYMSRLGLWGPNKIYKTFNEFCTSINSGGITAMEVVAINLKSYGIMSCRQLSYCGTEFTQESICLTDQMERVYDHCGNLVREMKAELTWFMGNSGLKALYEFPPNDPKGAKHRKKVGEREFLVFDATRTILGTSTKIFQSRWEMLFIHTLVVLVIFTIAVMNVLSVKIVISRKNFKNNSFLPSSGRQRSEKSTHVVAAVLEFPAAVLQGFDGLF